MLFKIYPRLNPFCNRVVYFKLPLDYNFINKSLDDLYNDSIEFSFIKDRLW